MDEDPDPNAENESCNGIEPFLSVLLSFPRVGDDIWLSMQARYVALVNAHIADIEPQIYDEYWASDHPVTPTTHLVSGLTQMWVFALYELIRTSRDIRNLPDEQREALAPAVARAKEAMSEPWFQLHGLRVSLAKHERPGQARQPAFMPGYVRIDGGNGSLLFQWQEEGRKVVDEDGDLYDTGPTHFTSRRSIVLGLIAAGPGIAG
jgi:hypothetical protein